MMNIMKFPRKKGTLSREKMISLYLDDGWSTNMIAEVDGTSRVGVLKALRSMGVKLRSPGSGSHLRKWRTHGLTSGHKKAGVAPQTISRLRLILVLGGRCCACGTEDLRLLEINHKDHSTKKKLSYTEITRIFKERPVDIEVRCANCNVLYEYETGKRILPPLEIIVCDLLNRKFT